MKSRTIALAALSIMAANAWAQPVWNFGQVMQAALVGHPLILGKRSAEAAAAAEREGAEWQRYPSVSVEASAQSGGQNGRLLRVEQPIWNGGRIMAGINAAGSRRDAAGAALDEARQELTLKVIAATTEALRQQARQQHAGAGVREHEKLLGMIERRVAQEVSAQADQRLAASRLYASVNELSVTNQALNNALVQLSQLAGQTVGKIDSQGLSEAGAPASLAAAQTLALANSPTLRRLAFEEQGAAAEIDAKRSAYLPQLVLRLESGAAGVTGQGNSSRAMLVLLAQPGAGLSARSGVEAAIARREAAQLAREAAQRDLRERVALDWNEWMEARQRLENANQARAMSNEVFESYARQYTAGRKTWIDVLNAVRETTQAALAAEDVRTQMLAASLRLRALGGTLIGPSGALQ